MHPQPMQTTTDTGSEEIESQLRPLLQQPLSPSTGEWLFELVQSSGHLSTPDHLRWRVLSTIWLAAEFDTDKVWPYLMWLNMNEPTIGDHLTEILAEAVDDFECHVQLSNWIAQAADERIATFFSTYKNIPHAGKIKGVFSRLLAGPNAPQTGTWLDAFCRHTLDNRSPSMRGWRLLAAAWVAAQFNAETGQIYLKKLSDDQSTLSPTDSRLLTDTANDLNATADLMQWIADCADPTIKTMLQDVGHPDLAQFAETTLDQNPDYSYLNQAELYAPEYAELFQRYQHLLEEAGLPVKNTQLLDLACGPLATYTILFAAAGCKSTGADLYIPPAHLPTSGFKQMLKKRKHAKAWRQATAAYYRALAQQTGLKLNPRKATIELADLTRLPWADGRFDVVACAHHLQHAPDVAGLLAEAARVLKPGGLLVGDIVPYASLRGNFDPAETKAPWGHLRQNEIPRSGIILNRWRETQYQTAIKQYFSIGKWLAEQNEEAVAQLTPGLKDELADFDEAELTRQQIIFVAKKKLG